MFLSYLKIAWKVLLRRKFFTFISLFGISFTLMILLVVYAMADGTAGPGTPERRTDRLLFVTRMVLEYRDGGTSNSALGYAFLDKYARTLKTPAKVSISEQTTTTLPAYVGNQTLKLDLKRTDDVFWQVLDFDFLEGRPFNKQEQRDAALVAVINENTARRYFGAARGVVGRVLELDAVRYRVVGVVRDVPLSRIQTYAEVWTPLSTTTANLRDPDYLGGYMAILLARSPADIDAVKAEYQQVIDRVPLPDPKEFKKIYSRAHTLFASLLAHGSGDTSPDGASGLFTRIAAALALLFMLLPALNLVNVNVSRTLERASEIGVRKAFGATTGALMRQFLLENIFLTLLGGLLGLALAAGALAFINSTHLIPYAQFALNGRVFLVALGLALVFGMLSGVYPAYKMSKLQAAQVLKGETAL
ncbi:ABC transporter permease [Hymenobacter lapidiphilus]|uniref:ABC transporter permease n=1 Tax=Hymenobacter sp. CCM 8763 TaxID=2303334 RepID=UPI000E34BD9A|nr:ABC transporter permease [Hymenobacter sp. CCM 8763]RFP63356.1 ABC transporter permease [Hymenobacter sp. CCM 8763]